MDFKKYLTENILPFWLGDAIDRERGGIFTCLDREGRVYGYEKSVWFQGRALWVFSKAYNHVEKREEYLAAAKTIYDFIPLCEDADGRMFFTVTREGRGIQKRRYYYSETFAAIGCAQYYKATGEAEAWERAEKYFAIAKRCFDDPTQNPPKYTTSAKALAPVMIMMNTARCMAECAPNGTYYAALAASYAEELISGGYFSEEVGALLESVSPDGKFVDTPAGRVVNPGHSLEAAWFLLVEGLLGKNEKALALGKRIIDASMPLGLDQKHGGIIAFTDVKGMPPSALEWDMKLWWPQNEAILANRIAYEIFREDKYKEAYESLLAFAFEKFGDDKHGEWYGYLHYDGTPSNELKGNIFKGPFHLPRMLMLLAAVESGDMMSFFR